MHAAAPIHAMIDISDGLTSDLGHILDESGEARRDARCRAPFRSTPTPTQLSAEDGRPPLDHALNDGEDFELCLVVARRGGRTTPRRAHRTTSPCTGSARSSRRRVWLRRNRRPGSMPIDPADSTISRRASYRIDDPHPGYLDHSPRAPSTGIESLGRRHRCGSGGHRRMVEPGTVIGLVGPLGAGKTRLAARSPKRSASIRRAIASPTFVLDPRVRGPNPGLPLRRLSARRRRGRSRPWGRRLLGMADGLCLVEWADRVADRLPADAGRSHRADGSDAAGPRRASAAAADSVAPTAPGVVEHGSSRL